jgi:hypothetical protein
LFGDVCINPWEYSVVNDVLPYLEAVKAKSAVLRYISNTKQLTGKLSEQVFYLRARGIGYSEALQLCIKTIKTQNLFYIEMTPPNAAVFTRNYLAFAKRKLEYVSKKDRPDLCIYPEYHLNDYIKHLES